MVCVMKVIIMIPLALKSVTAFLHKTAVGAGALLEGT